MIHYYLFEDKNVTFFGRRKISPGPKWDFFPSERPPWLESNSRRTIIRHLRRLKDLKRFMIAYLRTKTLPGLVGGRDFFSPEAKWDICPSERPPWLESNSRRRNIRHLWRSKDLKWFIITYSRTKTLPSLVGGRDFFSPGPKWDFFPSERPPWLESNSRERNIRN